MGTVPKPHPGILSGDSDRSQPHRDRPQCDPIVTASSFVTVRNLTTGQTLDEIDMQAEGRKEYPSPLYRALLGGRKLGETITVTVKLHRPGRPERVTEFKITHIRSS